MYIFFSRAPLHLVGPEALPVNPSTPPPPGAQTSPALPMPMTGVSVSARASLFEPF